LDNGFIVRGVVRSEDKAAQIKKTFPSEKFETAVVPDVITGDFTEALKGVNAVIHAASPFFLAEKLDDPKKEFLEPAVNGTLNVLRATHKAGIKRFISTATIGNVISKPNSKSHTSLFQNWRS
jgi:NADPH-dependent methylglyoxal reductase